MALSEGRARFTRAVRILADEKAEVKERLLTAYAAQLSRVNPRDDLPADLLPDYYEFRNAISDADVPYGSGERAAKKIRDMTDDQASALAGSIFDMFLGLCGSPAEQAAATVVEPPCCQEH
ncbi:MAG TPA: hypothetical protein VMV10_25105 [Pirellulales bacterium]|nr:hypothetical protein [Pirellulales bacterium]